MLGDEIDECHKSMGAADVREYHVLRWKRRKLAEVADEAVR